MRKYAKQIGVALLLSAAACTAIALPNDIGRPSQEEQKRMAQKMELAEQDATEDIILHYRWDGEDTPHVYYENVNDSGQQTISYPGIPMKNTKDGWYSYTIQDADSADIIFTIGDSYVTATMNRVAGEWWFDQDTWYSWNPEEESDTTKVAKVDTKKAKSKKQINRLNQNVNNGDGEYRKSDVTTIAEDGSMKIGLSNIDTAEEYIDTYVVAQDLEAAEDASITIHYYAEDGEVPSIYFWNALPQDRETVWPGQPMTMESENWYQYTFDDVDKINFLFTYGLKQTEDLTRKTGEWWYKGGKWYKSKPASSGTSEDEKPVIIDKPDTYDFREETIYFLITTRFYDGDESNNVHCWDEKMKYEENQTIGISIGDPGWRGDFAGLIEKMDYIKALGFSAIWITPVVENASGVDYHGYHAMNFQKVDERYLSDGITYQTVINEAHKRGLKIIQDVVFNHTSNFGEANLAPMFEKDSTVEGGLETVNCMVKAENSILPDEYFSDEYLKRQYDIRLSLMKDHIDPLGTKKRNDSKSYFHRLENGNWDFYSTQLVQIAGDCVDLNTENPIVSKYLTDSYTKYINMGVDAFRVDTVKHISRLTFNNALIPALQAAGGNSFYMFGEACSRSNEVWYRGQTPALSAPFYTWKESKDYEWVYYDENVEKAYDDYANAIAEKTAGDFSSQTAYFNYRMEQETKKGLAHPINIASTEELYNDNANDVAEKEVKPSGTAQSQQPVSRNAFLDGNNYHEPDYSESNGFNVIDFAMHWNFSTAKNAFAAATHSYNYETGQVSTDNNDIRFGGDFSYNDSTWNVVYVDSHDYSPCNNCFYRYDQGTEAWAENMCLMFTFRGIPCLYYGSEVEFQAGKIIDPAGQGDPEDKEDKMKYADSGRAYFGDYLEGDVSASDFGEYTASGKVKETLEADLSQQLIRLNKIRRAIPALQKGQYNLAGITSGEGGMAFKRRYTTTDVDSYCLVTITGSAKFTDILNGTYKEVITGETVEVTDGTLSVDAPGKGNMRVYVLDTELTKAPGKIGSDTTFLK